MCFFSHSVLLLPLGFHQLLCALTFVQPVHPYTDALTNWRFSCRYAVLWSGRSSARSCVFYHALMECVRPRVVCNNTNIQIQPSKMPLILVYSTTRARSQLHNHFRERLCICVCLTKQQVIHRKEWRKKKNLIPRNSIHENKLPAEKRDPINIFLWFIACFTYFIHVYVYIHMPCVYSSDTRNV